MKESGSQSMTLASIILLIKEGKLSKILKLGKPHR